MSLHMLLSLILIASLHGVICYYEPHWTSLDTRPLPRWYDEAKFGIFIHWGVFSVPSYRSEKFWWDWQAARHDDVVQFMARNYAPNFKYQDFASEFKAELFDPVQWAKLLQASGAKYVVLTSKFHDGYTMWPSNFSWNWNAKDTGPKRDIVGDLASAIRINTELRFGLYYSLYEWFHPMFLRDNSTGFQNTTFPLYKALPELYELVNSYTPDVIWSSGSGTAPDTYWNSTQFLAWLYNESPVKDRVVTNDRWGSNGIWCQHGGFYTCRPTANHYKGIGWGHKWENTLSIDKYSFGYRREAAYGDYMTIEELISALAATVSGGGNLLVNIGPTKDGRIIPIFEERLRQMGKWLSVNGESIYKTVPWIFQNDTVAPNIWYTLKIAEARSLIVYAIVLNWPTNDILQLGTPTATVHTAVTMLGYNESLCWDTGPRGQGILVTFPTLAPSQLPWAWVLKLKNLAW